MAVRSCGALALAVLLRLPASAAAEVDRLDGAWIGWAVTPIVQGLTVPLIEEMVVTGDAVVQRGWRIPYLETGCRTGEGAEGGAPCDVPVEIGAARMVATDGDRAGAVEIVPEGPQTNPHLHPTDIALWPEMALAGHAWTLPAGGGAKDTGATGRLTLLRTAELDGTALPLERLYLRAPPGTGGMVYLDVVASDLSLARSICGVQALHADAGSWAVWLAHLEAVAPILAELHHLAHFAPPGAESGLRRATILLGPEALGARAADISDLPAEALRAYRDHVDWLQTGRPAPDGHRPLETLAWTAPEAVVALERGCVERLFEG